MNQKDNIKRNREIIKSLCCYNTGKKRLCLGVRCEGKKYFISYGKWNRICDKCKRESVYE